MKRIKMLDVEPLIIETADGKEIKALFNMGMIARYYDMYGTFVSVEEAVEKSNEITAKMLYCGILTAGNEIGVDLAFCEKLLAGPYGIQIRNVVNEELFTCLDSNLNEEQKKTLMGALVQMEQLRKMQTLQSP